MVATPSFWCALVLTVVLYWAVPRVGRPWTLFGASAIYLGWLEPRGTAVLLGWTLLVYWLGPRTSSEGQGRWVARGLLLALLGHLAAFKYLPPLLDALATGPMERAVVIPLGISYYTFKLLHYVIEVSRGRITERSLPDFLAWMFLFPIFTAGPIERLDHYLAHRTEHLGADGLVDGLHRIGWGLVKKFLVADWLIRQAVSTSAISDTVADLDGATAGGLWWLLGWTFLYSYLDFSAYSDIAIGASRLFGLRISENFNWPIASRNIGEFWQRWHMTLARWCQTYIYLPTIGRTRNPYAAAIATFGVMGLWHAGSWAWVCWGMWHAAGVMVYQTWSRLKRRRRWRWADALPMRAGAHVLTMAFVTCSYAFTALHGVGTVGDSIQVLLRMFGI